MNSYNEGLEVWLAYCEKKQELEEARDEIVRLREALRLSRNAALEEAANVCRWDGAWREAILALKENGDD